MSAGELLIIGGNEEKCRTAEILSRFIELAKQLQGTVGILPAASRIPDEVSADYSSLFKRLGAEQVDVLDIDSREKSNDAEMLKMAEGMAALFITGGDQERLSNLVRGTKLHQLLMDKWRAGMIIGGTSAGASIMGEYMIVYSETKINDDRLIIEMGNGFGLLNNLLIDQHFSQRGRFGRLIGAIAGKQDLIGIGIDENTAILVTDDKFEVLGEHQVFIIDGKGGSLVDNVKSKDGGNELTITDFKLHTLTAGYRFDLASRKIIIGKEE
jgi:cyanophycinase